MFIRMVFLALKSAHVPLHLGGQATGAVADAKDKFVRSLYTPPNSRHLVILLIHLYHYN